MKKVYLIYFIYDDGCPQDYTMRNARILEEEGVFISKEKAITRCKELAMINYARIDGENALYGEDDRFLEETDDGFDVTLGDESYSYAVVETNIVE